MPNTLPAKDTLIQTENLFQFYQRTNQEIPVDLLQERSEVGHFNVKQTTIICRKTPYNRRDYFKICLSNGEGNGVLRYQDQEILLDGPCLIFTNPSVPASIEIRSSNYNRFYCLFNHRFIESYIHPGIRHASPLFNASLHPVIRLTKDELEKISHYFMDQQSLLESDYPFKWDMIRNLLLLLIHEGIRLQENRPDEILLMKDRVVNGFFTLLNQQFPIDSPANPLKLLTPAAFADLLHVHVNHLNSVIKKHTGKTTRVIIHERVIAEAKTLLQNTDWNIAEIAYALGFEYPSHFNKYFKQFTSLSPREFRSKTTALSL
jgi:AraC family transcriptional regulator, transcriptional activator of pobA